MFQGLSNFMDLFRQAGRIQSEMKRLNDELKQVVVEGSSGGGLVRVRANGLLEIISCKIERSAVEDDPELLEDLVCAAVNQALEKSREAAKEKFGAMFGSLNVPGLPDVLTQLRGS